MEVPKRKPKTPKKSAEQFQREAGEQLANLELRAALDPYLEKVPLARLGYDIIERGEIPGSGPGGEILAYVSDPTRLSRDTKTGTYYETPSYGSYGVSVPSDFFDSLDPEGRSEYASFLKYLENKPELANRLFLQLGNTTQAEGIASLLPTSEGSTIYYQEGKGVEGAYQSTPDAGLMTLAHELAHLGQKAINKRAGKKLITPSREEMMVRSYFPKQAQIDTSLPLDSYREQMDAAALKELGMRGVPVQIKPKTSEKLMGLFGG
jgi:hypothetical protein